MGQGPGGGRALVGDMDSILRINYFALSLLCWQLLIYTV